MAIITEAKFSIGQAVRHRTFDYAGVIIDADPVFAETDAWFAAIPEASRPDRNQPFYRVRVDYDGVESLAYVSEQNLVADALGESHSIVELINRFAGEGLCAQLH
ncbi:heat shock protein HspQ [Acuticoccus yangtzensis]|uniref:heat shock protein HspQ n=1 Tax=Acuticoccus yangtzensis TaxID=1443441 RepID=UPI0009497F24|nr:heat shock protein HspQ [Acuticoccus yangtzensis]ORE90775.1 hemimethylated DNA binding protein [Stappia sp. 22II-S9-Z10]